MKRQNRVDIIVCSKELKRVIRNRIKELDISLYNVCKDGDFDYKKFNNYMNAESPVSHNVTVKQDMLIEFCEFIGIEIRVTIKLHNIN